MHRCCCCTSNWNIQQIEGGIGKYYKAMVNFTVDQPFIVYLMGGFSLLAVRKYSTQTTFNYWFGKHEFERRLGDGKI